MRRPQNFKNLPPVLTKQLLLLYSVKTSGRFFQIFVAFSEKLDLKKYYYGSIQLRLYTVIGSWYFHLDILSLIKQPILYSALSVEVKKISFEVTKSNRQKNPGSIVSIFFFYKSLNILFFWGLKLDIFRIKFTWVDHCVFIKFPKDASLYYVNNLLTSMKTYLEYSSLKSLYSRDSLFKNINPNLWGM